MGFGKSSVFRGRHGARLMTAWLAVVVQLHIFLVLELHRHVLTPRILRDIAPRSAAWTKSQTAPAPAPLCPACQVARQGSVQPAVQKLALLPLQTVGSALPSRISNLPVLFLLHPSGRDPPNS
ncbi:MAG: hypothetical protein WB819_16755 [Terriglobia bacterium]|jgi:hypothetical protein